MGKQNLLEIKDLVVEYQTDDAIIHAVNGVDLVVKEGETLGLVGETGAGKTTIARTILRILPKPQGIVRQGGIFFEGAELLSLHEKAMRKLRGNKIAMVFQDPMTALNPIERVGDQIAEAILLHNNMTKGEAIKRAQEMLEMVGIPGMRYVEYPHQFSGGMKQRVVIAMALACNPKLLLADEPTTALDVTIQAQVLRLINDLKEKVKASVLLITHDLGVVANVADRIAVMYAGDIIEIGTAEEVFFSPQHPYTWALLSSLPQLGVKGEKLYAIRGTPPNLFHEVIGDAFAPRSDYALNIDYVERPPYFDVSPTHRVRSWLKDPRAPKAVPPPTLARINPEGGSLYADK